MKLKHAKQLAQDEMEKRLDGDWRFKFDDAARRFGYCSYNKKTISLSRQITKLNDKQAVREAILHEIAHALTGYGHGHNDTWKGTAIGIGCSASRTYDSNVIPQPSPRWLAVCDNCGHEVPYMVRRRQMACGRCCRKYNYGKYTKLYLITWIKP